MSASGRPKPETQRRSPAARSGDGHVAAALRDAYDEAVREEVPGEFLELLGKLA